MGFDSSGLVWIQTDGDDSNEEDFAGMGNNQMLVGDPETGEIWDETVTNDGEFPGFFRATLPR